MVKRRGGEDGTIDRKVKGEAQEATELRKLGFGSVA